MTKDPFGRVNINIVAIKEADFGNLEIIALLPAGYAPSRIDIVFKYLTAAGNGAGVGFGFIQFGYIYVEAPPAGVRQIRTVISFDLS